MLFEIVLMSFNYIHRKCTERNKFTKYQEKIKWDDGRRPFFFSVTFFKNFASVITLPIFPKKKFQFESFAVLGGWVGDFLVFPSSDFVVFFFIVIFLFSFFSCIYLLIHSVLSCFFS